MKEKIREISLSGNLKISYISGDGTKQAWAESKENLSCKIFEICEEYEVERITLTCRQLYYQLVARDYIPNADEVYKRICALITDLRYGGLIDWDLIEDRGRVPEKPSEWKNIKSLVKTALSAYRLPRWKDQKFYVELFCEKQAMESILKPVCEDYHIYFCVNKGYSSASNIYTLAKRILTEILDGKMARIIYFGDHDPSGLDMIRDIKERVLEIIFDELASSDSGVFDVVPAALTMEQIKKFCPPPNPAKITDPRAKWYLEKYGKKSWELDSLEPKILIGIAEKSIQEFLNSEKYNSWIVRENEEKGKLLEFSKSIEN